MQNLENLKALAEALPDAVKQNALDLVERMGATIEGIGDEAQTWRPPFIRLVQGTTDRTSIPKGTAIGDMVLGETKLEAPFNFIPLRMWVERHYWDPDPTKSARLCQSPDAKVGYIGAECRSCPHAEWVEGQGSDCGKVHAGLFISADLSQIFSINFSKTGYSAGTEFVSQLKKAAVDPYRRTYALSSETVGKNVEVYKIEALPADKRRTPDEYVAFLKELFTLINTSRQEALTAFYKTIEDKRAAGQLQIQLVPFEQKALEAPASGAGEVTDITPTETAKPAANSKAKGYQV